MRDEDRQQLLHNISRVYYIWDARQAVLVLLLSLPLPPLCFFDVVAGWILFLSSSSSPSSCIPSSLHHKLSSGFNHTALTHYSADAPTLGTSSSGLSIPYRWRYQHLLCLLLLRRQSDQSSPGKGIYSSASLSFLLLVSTNFHTYTH